MLGQVRVGSADDLSDVGHLGARGPHLLPVDDPLVAVLDRPGLERSEVRSGGRLAEELAGNEVSPPEFAQVGVLHLVGGVGQDRGSDHTETDAVDRERRRLIVGRDPPPDPLVVRGQSAAAVLGRSGDPAEAGIEHLLGPGSGCSQVGQLLLGGALRKQADVVRPLTPDEGLFGPPFGIGVQECKGSGLELLWRGVGSGGRRTEVVYRGGGGHDRNPLGVEAGPSRAFVSVTPDDERQVSRCPLGTTTVSQPAKRRVTNRSIR